jgi:thymidine phosphorylase
MDAPLGCAVGNALEVIESLEALKGRGPAALVDLSVELSARMLLLAGLAAGRADAERRVRHAIASGDALARFQSIVESQGGDPRVVDNYGRLPTASGQHPVLASRSGYVTGLDADLIGRASVALGAGRDRVDDAVDPAVGITVVAGIGHPVSGGDPVLTLHYRTEARLDTALPLARSAIHVGDEPPRPRPPILASIT